MPNGMAKGMPINPDNTRNDATNTMSASSTDKGLLTPDNCGVIFIDYQPRIWFGAANADRQSILSNVLLLAKTAKIFAVPVILTAVESEWMDGNIAPQLLELFPDATPIKHSGMNSWDSKEVVAAVKQTRRKNFLVAALWSDAHLTFPSLQMLEEGYGVYAVVNASGGTSHDAHTLAIRRIEQAGAVSVTALQVLLEFQRDWARKEHYEEVMAVIKEHCVSCGREIEHVYSMIEGIPALSDQQIATSKNQRVVR